MAKKRIVLLTAAGAATQGPTAAGVPVDDLREFRFYLKASNIVNGQGATVAIQAKDASGNWMDVRTPDAIAANGNLVFTLTGPFFDLRADVRSYNGGNYDLTVDATD